MRVCLHILLLQISPTQFLETINSINEILISAYSPRKNILYTLVTIFSLQIARLFITPHYDTVKDLAYQGDITCSSLQQEMRKLEELFKGLNLQLYNPVGLNLLWPKSNGFQFVSLRHYTRATDH